MEKIKTTLKKSVGLLLALCLLLTLSPAVRAADDLPKVGDTVHGFTVKETRDFPLIGAELVLFEHEKTGAKLMYIANDDTNRVFDLTFLTDAIDDTGLPHVFEHSTLDGSEKYPSKALFFNLSYQTYNTYMNAATYQWMTTYPIASLSEAQLLKYADYYTDSCLHPMIMEDESIYREEAWRYRLADEDAPLTIEGTVYSEMLGAMDLASTASKNNLRTAFPGSMAGNVSGGDPAYIPDMTWDMLKDYHNTYYHPSNCLAFLYGSFEDYTAFLKLLDDAFSPFEKKEFTRSDSGYTPITEPQTASFAFPVEAGSDTKNASTIYYTFVCPGLKGQDELVLNTMTDLLYSDASALQQSLKKALPSGTFYAYIDSTGPENAITFVAESVGKDDAQTFKATVDAALADIAANGFPQELVDAVMTSSAIDTMLVGEQGEVGVNMISDIAYYYAFSDDIWGYPAYVEALDSMDDWNAQGLYAKAVSDYLLGSQTTALTTTYPEAGLKEQNDAAEAARLAEVKAAMSPEEIAAIVAASNAEDEEEDDAAKYVAELQAVTVKSLPEEVRTYEVKDETDGNGIRHIDAVAGVDGIGMAAVMLDAAGVAQEDLHWFKLFTDLVGETDTEHYSRAEVATLSGRYLYNGSVYISLTEQDGFHPYLRMSWIALDDDLDEGYDLMREMVFAAKVDDAQTVLENVQSLKASLKSAINSAPYNVQLSRALAVDHELFRYSNYVNNLEYYDFLGRVEQQLEADPASVCENLLRLRDQLANSTNAVAIYAGNEESIALNRGLSDKFLESLGSEAIEPASYDLPVPEKAEGMVIDSNVQFNSVIASYEALGLGDYDGGIDAVTALVSDSFLYPLLRDQYGAYGVFHGSYGEDGVYIISYRDPNVGETFEVYESLPELIAALELDQDTLDGYILSSYVGYATPEGELSGALNAAFNALEGKSQDQAKEWMEQLKAITPETLASYSDMYEKLVADGVISTAGSASAINANADRYTAILDPFGVKDAPAAEFAYEDVPEDSWAREAVEFAWENDLMDGVSETAFGPNEAVTKGELSAAIYSLYNMLQTGMGELADPEEAMEWAVEAGLIEGEAAETATRSELAAIVCWFNEAIGMDVTPEGDLSVFSDGAEAGDEMSWAVGAGLMNGMGDGTIAPNAAATRAQAASVMMRYLTNVLVG